MNKTLFKANMKSNWGIFLFISGMLMIYISISVTMFNPDNADAMQAMFDMLPEGMIKAFGFEGLGMNLTTYLAGYLYGFILVVFPLIYTIVLANSLVVNHVDKGSMAYLLATPNTRTKIAFTQAMYFIISTLVMFATVIGILIAMSCAVWPGHLEIGKFLVLNLVTVLIIITVGSVSFLASCVFNETKGALAVGGGIPILFVLFKMVGDISEEVEFFKYFTPYTLLDTNRILSGGSYVWIVSLVLICISAILYTFSIYIFNKKSLSI